MGVFASPKGRALWLLNLNSPSLHLDFVARLGDMPADVVFCDGGYRRAIRALDRRHKRLVLVGDLDSIGAGLASLPADVELVRDPSQDRNDLQKGLDLICRRLAPSPRKSLFESESEGGPQPEPSREPERPVVVVNGVTGSRLDHQM